jgi:hypothetical protein
MKCDKCGFENLENGVYCQECGNRIKPKRKQKFQNLINWKAIIIGVVSYFLLMLVVIAISFEIYNADNASLLEYVFMMSISGIITGYISGKEYLSGITNSLIIVVFYSIIMGLFAGLIVGLGWLTDLSVFGVIGSLIGVVIYRKYNNYYLIGSSPNDSTAKKKSLGIWLGAIGLLTLYLTLLLGGPILLPALIFILALIFYKSK